MGSVRDDSNELTKTENVLDYHQTVITEIALSEKVKNESESKTEEAEILSENVLDRHQTVITEIVVSEKVENATDIERVEAEIPSENEHNQTLVKKNPVIVFVLGGPGGGKSTQCSNLAKEIGYTHLSSGELLRKARKSDLENGPLIESLIKEGKSVPPDVTMRILLKAMSESGTNRFLLDGFPRDDEIRVAFESAVGIEPEMVLFFDCSEEERERRILNRDQGRVDDNPESIRKRFNYFEQHTLPVVEYYRAKGKVYQIDAAKPMEEVFETLKSFFRSLIQPDEEIPSTSSDLENGISELKL
ncbi:UMP-CMP kinase 3-like [Mercurialis annua]|uniref:UMP-CMP kinase 3-like n=1 Tax=Mercurialis annua TaxID=3986 RepID=UPI00215E76B7|nr:UMP-CMP kinase 3-like [Mercurialis annua]